MLTAFRTRSVNVINFAKKFYGFVVRTRIVLSWKKQIDMTGLVYFSTRNSNTIPRVVAATVKAQNMKKESISTKNLMISGTMTSKFISHLWINRPSKVVETFFIFAQNVDCFKTREIASVFFSFVTQKYYQKTIKIVVKDYHVRWKFDRVKNARVYVLVVFNSNENVLQLILYDAFGYSQPWKARAILKGVISVFLHAITMSENC